MIEKTILDFLTEQLPDIPIYMETPESPPDAFILIEKTAGGRTNYIQEATLAIQSYGASLYKAAALNESVKELMLDSAPALDALCKVRLNSDYNFTDTRTKRYRYQAVYDIKYY